MCAARAFTTSANSVARPPASSAPLARKSPLPLEPRRKLPHNTNSQRDELIARPFFHEWWWRVLGVVNFPLTFNDDATLLFPFRARVAPTRLDPHCGPR